MWRFCTKGVLVPATTKLRAVFLMGVCVPCSFLFIVLGTVRHPPLAQEGVEVGVVSMGDGHGTPAGFVLWHA